jgi:hypothetical protein
MKQLLIALAVVWVLVGSVVAVAHTGNEWPLLLTIAALIAGYHAGKFDAKNR